MSDEAAEELAGRRVLVVDDDETVLEVSAAYLSRAGFDVATASDAFSGLDRAAGFDPHLVVLDRMLPGVDGIEVARRLRQSGPVPIIMLTALGSEEDRIAGLEAGVDDYVTKPFSPRELVLRVRSVLRRSRAGAEGRVDVVRGPFALDATARVITAHGEALGLTSREFDLLAFLLRRPGEVFSRERLLAEVWGWDVGDLSTVTVHVRRLREKIEQDPSSPVHLVTVWGVGYRLDPDGRSP